MALVSRHNNLEEERKRLAAIVPATWRDSDGNLIAPMRNEHNQNDVDWAAIEELYKSVDDIEKFLKG